MKTKISLKNLEIIGAIFGIIFGTSLHFLFEWSGGATWVGLFSSVNESVWEHMKLFFIPLILFLVVEWFFVSDKRKLLFAKMSEAVLGMLFIISVFYTYTGALGVESLAFDIFTFMVAVILGKILSYKIITSEYKPKFPSWIYGIGLLLILSFIIMATFNPPRIPLFLDTEANGYGVLDE